MFWGGLRLPNWLTDYTVCLSLWPVLLSLLLSVLLGAFHLCFCFCFSYVVVPYTSGEKLISRCAVWLQQSAYSQPDRDSTSRLEQRVNTFVLFHRHFACFHYTYIHIHSHVFVCFGCVGVSPLWALCISSLVAESDSNSKNVHLFVAAYLVILLLILHFCHCYRSLVGVTLAACWCSLRTVSIACGDFFCIIFNHSVGASAYAIYHQRWMLEIFDGCCCWWLSSDELAPANALNYLISLYWARPPEWVVGVQRLF